MRQIVISELFFKGIAEKGKLYSRIWMYWLGNYVDELLDSGFLEKQKDSLSLPKDEIEEIYNYGVQLLSADFKIIEKKQSKIPNHTRKLAEEVIDYLNEKSNKNFSKKDINIKLIVSRIKEGYNLDDFKYVIDKKCHDWLGTNYQEYLRPATLFSNKFENYITTKNDKPSPTSFEQFALEVAKAQSISFRRNK
jgi:uncharacterized phage protein (TIGR02220 family)